MATNDKGLTPMMRQFFSMKEKHPEALLLFRCGDFYETYCDDAVEAARILGITLTRRNNGAASGAEMAGFPHHALDTYLPKLIARESVWPSATNWRIRRKSGPPSKARRAFRRWTRW